MKRRHLIRILAMTAMGTSASFAAGAEGETDVLRVGESLRYDEDLKITFLAVTKDQRCPINAQCLTQGDAVVVLRVKAGNQAARNVRIHTDLKPRTVVIPANEFPPGTGGIPKSYLVGIAKLNPLPTAGKTTPQSRYRLRLRISVAV